MFIAGTGLDFLFVDNYEKNDANILKHQTASRLHGHLVSDGWLYDKAEADRYHMYVSPCALHCEYDVRKS